MRIRILEAAKQEFAAHGLAGARVDRIAANAGANKRMLYYHVGNKENLYLAVLEGAYEKIRFEERRTAGEASINGQTLLPLETTVANGKKLVAIRANLAVEAIRKALATP